MQQISLFHLFILETQLMLESCDQTDQNLFLTMLPPPNFFDQRLNYVNLYQDAKN